MLPAAYINEQTQARRQVLAAIHAVIPASDTTVTAVVEKMMGKEMIIYKAEGMMKYALASGKNYMSLHVLPIYGSPVLHNKYKALLDKASFQKGCINFTDSSQLPINIVQQLISECAPINLRRMKEDWERSKKAAAKAKR